MQKQKNKQKGITLISLVVTIIVLIILAGVSINMIVGDNGIITQAQKATEDTKQAQEKESIQLAILQASMEGEIENVVGIPLYDRTIENGTKWHILMNKHDGTTYGSGWNYVKANTEIPGYGVAEQSWLMNSQTGEIFAINEDDYIETYYGMNLAVTEGLLLNVDPVNMQDENSWGEGVTLYGVTPGDGYGYTGDAIWLDGVDDYIEVYADTPIDTGFTFEFYGKSEDDAINMLSKTIVGETGNGFAKRFRVRIGQGAKWFKASFSGINAESDWSPGGDLIHWIQKELDCNFSSEKGEYFTMVANLENNTVSLYMNGEFIDSTVCSHEWLISGQLTDNTVPFTIGLVVSGQVYTTDYSAMELYACRLYDRVLTDEEITDNYETTVAYREQ